MAKPYLGVWVDHREAYLVWADDGGRAELQHADSEYPERQQKEHLSIGGAGGSFGGVPPHADLGAKQRREARRFHERLVPAIRHADVVYIFGPGQAKKELHRQLAEHKDFAGSIHGVESAERMSEAQLVAHVRAVFGLPRSPEAA
jgi:hypothetical protein